MTAPSESAVFGPLFIVSGPSGSGKTTLIQRVLAKARWPLRLSVSATTRLPRAGETEGVDYYYWDRDRFEAAVGRGEFLEHAEVHGRYYGTLEREVTPHRAAGTGVILDIDVQGARQVRAREPHHVSVFISTSSLDAYEARLRRRGTEDEEAIRRRLGAAREELTHAPEYQYQILNDDLDAAEAQLVAVIAQEFSHGEAKCSKT